MSLFSSLLRPKRRIFIDSSSSRAREAFHLEGHALTENGPEAELIWMRKGYTKLFPHLRPFQLINHFPGESALINKGDLTAKRKRHEDSRTDDGLALADFYRESYRLHDPQERREFFSQLPRVDQRDNIWIYKPSNESRGRGIEIMWRFNKLRRRYRKLGNQPITDPDAQGIIQRYIPRPLLLNGRKSEMRIYWMVASLDPLLVLVYREGTVRLNSLPYQLDKFDNQLIHVTNVYQQKNHPDFDPSVVLKWRFADLAKYLSEDLGVAGPDFIDTELMPRINRILAWVTRAGRADLFRNHPRRGDCFAVFGADIILDENLNPWLTEIQKGPGLSFDDEVKRHVIPPMLGEAARIAFEVRERRLKGKNFNNLKSVDRYQWVLNEAQPEREPSVPASSFDRFRGRVESPDSVALPS